MKKINLLFVVLALIFTSCFDDKDDVFTPQVFDTSGDIVGVWVMQPVNYSGPISAKLGGTPLQGTVTANSYDENYSLTFSEEPNEVVSDGTFSMNLFASAQGISHTEDVVDFEFPNTGVWTRTGNQLTIVNGDQTTIATIIELTSTTLRLSFSPSDFNIGQYIVPDFVTDVVIYDNVIITFTRMALPV